MSMAPEFMEPNQFVKQTLRNPDKHFLKSRDEFYYGRIAGPGEYRGCISDAANFARTAINGIANLLRNLRPAIPAGEINPDIIWDEDREIES